MGVEQDMLNSISHEYLLSTARGNPALALEDRTLDFYTGTCENPHLRFDLVLSPYTMRNTEVHLSAIGIFNRVDGASYYSYGEDPADYEYQSFYSYGHELGIETALVKAWHLGPLRLYGGAGGNLGYSFGNEVNIYTSQTESVNDISIRSEGYTTAMDNLEEWRTTEVSEYHDGKNGFHERIFLKAGLGISFFKRIELGVDVRKGLGLRQFVGAPLKGSDYTSIALTAKYLLRTSCCKPKPACCKG